MELSKFTAPKEVTPLLLNVYWDGVVLYDTTGELDAFLAAVKERIEASGLERLRDGDAYRWLLPEPGRKVEVL